LATGAATLMRRSVARQGQVRATDAAVDWRLSTDTAYHGVARFTLAADGPQDVQLRLPDGCGLLRCAWTADASGARSPGAALPLATALGDDGLWQVHVGPQSMPRVLDVTFAGVLASPAAGAVRLESPELLDVAVEETRWTVTLPAKLGLSPPEGAERSVAQGQQVISLSVAGPESHVLRLTIDARNADSLGRRMLVLAMLATGVALALVIRHVLRRRGEKLAPQADSSTG
jgi:hypothetical protein